MIDLQPTASARLSPPSVLERGATLALEGELCQAELAELYELLARLVGRNVREVVLDFSEVSHLDYRGVKPLMRRAEAFRALGGDLKVCGLSPYLHAIFRSAGAHDAFEYFADAEQARAAYARGS